MRSILQRLSSRWLVSQAMFLLVEYKLLLWLRPTKTLQRFLSNRQSTSRSATGSPVVNAIPAAVRVASRYVPATTCLTRALAVLRLFERHGHSATLRIGVSSQEGAFQAHAWVESDGKTVIGNLRDGVEFAALRRIELPAEKSNLAI